MIEDHRDSSLESGSEHRRIVFAEIQRTILAIARSKKKFNVDDVRRLIEIPNGIDPRIVGTAFSCLRREGLIERIDSNFTSRPVAHGRPVYVWQLVGEEAAPSAKQASEALEKLGC